MVINIVLLSNFMATVYYICDITISLLQPLGLSTFILDHKALQSPVSTILPRACSSVGCFGSLTAPPKLPSHTSCSPIAFWTGETPAFPPAPTVS